VDVNERNHYLKQKKLIRHIKDVIMFLHNQKLKKTLKNSEKHQYMARVHSSNLGLGNQKNEKVNCAPGKPYV
jgi:hypothetical protein